MAELPSATVTFLFTDVEGSTRLWDEIPDAMRPALARHDAILRDAIESHGGHVVKTTGDGFHVAFATVHAALDAAVSAQRALGTESFGETGPLRVRMGLHTCEAQHRDGDYYGGEVNRAARLMSVAHGGQIVVSLVTSVLVRDAGVDLADLGEHRLRDLATVERVYQVVAPGLTREFPPLRSLDVLPGNLPRQITTFVGRQAELASLAAIVRESSLVTLTGVGGVGKTRLALQVAAEVVADFPDGAWMCELAPVTDPGAVWETLAASLRVQAHPGRGPADSILEYLAPKHLLLVLDNCEHLLDAAARVVDAITQRCERVTVLATSREGLALTGERIVAVPSLGIPPDGADLGTLRGADAVQLFSDRASVARSDFVLTDRAASAVGVLCRRLDGIPLAIELAAARVRSLSPDDLVARLDQRFKLLTRGSRAALERHQTLRSTIDWSYDLLSPPERLALNRLSVFAGGCDLTAAETVLASDDLDRLDVVDVLGQLVDKSLVVADTGEDDAGTRYRLLESIRQYAQERLAESGDSAPVRCRHADYYTDLAEAIGPHLRRREQIEWAGRARRDTDNFRAVLDWAAETPSPEHAVRLVAPFAVTGMAIGDAAREWADIATTIPGADAYRLFPAVAGFASLSASFRLDFERAEAFAETAARAQVLLGTPAQPVLQARTVLAIFREQRHAAREYVEAWVALARAGDDPWDLVLALIPQAGVVMSEHDVAAPILEEAVRVSREAGIASLLSHALPLLASMLPIEDSERALTLLDEAIEVGTAVGDRLGVTLVLETQANIAARRGEWPTALRTALEAAELKLQLGDLASIVESVYLAGVALAALERPDPAAALLGTADALPGGRDYPDWTIEMVAAADAALREALGEQRLVALKAQGAAFEIADALAYLRAEAESVLAAFPEQ